MFTYGYLKIKMLLPLSVNKKRAFYISRIILCSLIFFAILLQFAVLASSSASADDELHVQIPAKSVRPPRALVPLHCV